MASSTSILKVSPHFLRVMSVALCLLLCRTAAQPMTLNRQGFTVAGEFFKPEQVNGPLGVSRFFNPVALCGDHNVSDLDNNVFLVSDSTAFRTFDRLDNYLNTWFSSTAANSANVDGPLSGSNPGSMVNPSSCQRYISSGNVAAIFFTVGTNNVIRYIVNEYLYTYTYPQSNTYGALVALSIHGNRLYAQFMNNNVLGCNVGLATASQAISGCALIPLSQTPTVSASVRERGILATENGLLLASGAGLHWYSSTGQHIASTSSNIPFIDVRRDPRGNYFAATNSALYRVTLSGTTLTVSLWAGTEGSCNIGLSSNHDGLDPTFCGINRIFPFSENEIYMTIPSGRVLRALQLPPVRVTFFFGRVPFPVGMVGADAIMPNLEAIILNYLSANVNRDDPTLQAAYPPTLNASATELDDGTWNTYFTVNIPQQAFDNTTTIPEVWGADYGPALEALEAYYNLTNEVFYGDRNVLPTCNRTKMFLVEKDIADGARTALNYSLVYTNQTRPISNAENVTGIKLLIPSSFSSTTNSTTTTALKSMNFTKVYLDSVASHYPDDSKITLNFSSATYHMDQLTEAQQQTVRFMIQKKVQKRLGECAAVYGPPTNDGSAMQEQLDDSNSAEEDLMNNGIGGGEKPELVCMPIIGITNQTRTPVPGSADDDFDYDLFIPEGYGFNKEQLQSCMDNTDWGDIKNYITGATTKNKRKCGTGCIVGIAVAAAVVACVLVVVLVVLTSKRRRLAAVVAPPEEKAADQPGFATTLDDEDYGEDGENPFRA